MFEAVISMVKTGRVVRRAFESRDEAEQFLDQEREKLVCPPRRWSERRQEWQEQKPKSMRDFRMEVVRLDAAVVLKVAGRVAARRRAA